MIIALTGTPGTGKTTVCEIIREHSQYKKQYSIIDVNKIVLNEKLYTGKDEARDTYEADMDKLKERIELEIHKAPRTWMSFWRVIFRICCQWMLLSS